MDVMKFENIESSKLASDIVLTPLKRATAGILSWQHLGPHIRLTVSRYPSKDNKTPDVFGVKIVLRLPDGRCLDCEKKAETLSVAAEKLSRSLHEFVQQK